MYYICISSYIRLQMKKANVLAILAYEKRFLGNLSLCCDLLSFLVSLCCKEQLMRRGIRSRRTNMKLWQRWESMTTTVRSLRKLKFLFMSNCVRLMSMRNTGNAPKLSTMLLQRFPNGKDDMIMISSNLTLMFCIAGFASSLKKMGIDNE